jgi:hypothetical protein
MVEIRGDRYGDKWIEWYTRILETPSLKRAQIKKNLIKILEEYGFKRSFLKYPNLEVYIKEDLEAWISKIKQDKLAPLDQKSPSGIGVSIRGSSEKQGELAKKILYHMQQYKKSAEPERKISGIESRLAVFILFTLVGIALSLSSLKLTGNAVSNLTGTSQGLLGIFLFIAGLVGVFFCSKKK